MSAPETSTVPKEPPPQVETPNLEKKAEIKECVLPTTGTNNTPQQQNTTNVEAKPNEQLIETKQINEVKIDAISGDGKEKPVEVNKKEDVKEELKINSEQKDSNNQNKEGNKKEIEVSGDKPSGLVETNEKKEKIEDKKQNDANKCSSSNIIEGNQNVQQTFDVSIVSADKQLSEEKPLQTGIIETENKPLNASEQLTPTTAVESSISETDTNRETILTENKSLPADTVQNESLKNDLPLQQSEEKKATEEPKTESSNNEEENDDECANMQEMIEQVMNIINDGVAGENSNRQELLKKNLDLQQFIVKLIHLLKEKTDLCVNLDRQNSALISQAKSLKDVISITKDLLGIRNMEVEHLRADLDAMQECIQAERNRHNTAVQHLTEAMGLNDKLKAEYLTQMDLFEKLKEKYTEKVVILTRENIRLNALMRENGIDTSATESEPTEQIEANPDPNQPESVDK